MIAGWVAAAGLAIPLSRQVPSRIGWGVLFALAITLRIAVATCFAGRTPAGDALAYIEIAHGMLQGEGIRFHDPFIGSTLRALYPPLYPIVLAGWTSLWGPTVQSLLGLNTLIDGATAYLLYRLGAKFGRAGSGRAAAWAYILWPSVLLSAPLAQKEGLCTLLILSLALAWCRAIEPDRGSRWHIPAVIGLLTGLLALTQPGEAPLGLLFGLVLIPVASLRRVMAAGLRALPFAALVMLPWWVRNALVLGAFVPLTSAGQVSLWIGNNPDSTGNWEPTPPELRGLPELQYARAAGGLAMAWIAVHPGDFLRLTATKFVRALGVSQFGVQRLSFETPPPGRLLTGLLFPLAQASHLFLLAASAAALSFQRWRIGRTPALLLLGCFLQLTLFGVWFEFGERHREFLTPILLLAIAMGFLKERRERPE
ncbi:hypothetical protein BH09PSE4_BH09PSE4_10970 [soil metagenome]